MLYIVIIILIIAVLALIANINYRKFMPKPRALGEECYNTEIRPLIVEAGDHVIYGELLIPKGKKLPLPTVICCHGFSANYKLTENMAGKSLAMSGFAVYCFDFYGGSKSSKSGGKMTEMSIFTERNDLEAVISEISKQPEVDSSNLFLLGESQGGCVSAITAPRYSEKFKAMVLYYPALCIPDDARKLFNSVDDIPDVYNNLGTPLGKVYAEKLLDFDVFKEIQGYEKPVLIIHGNADKVVDISYGKRAAEAYKNAEFIELPDEPHGFTGKGKQIAVQKAYDFLRAI